MPLAVAALAILMMLAALAVAAFAVAMPASVTMSASMAAVVLFFVAIGDLEQLDLEVERLAGHLVIEVEGDGGVIHRIDRGGHRLSHGATQDHAHAHARVLGARHVGDGHANDHVVAALAIGLGRLKTHVDRLANLHVAHGRVKAGDHLASHAREAQRLVAVAGRVKLGAVVKRAHVVHGYTLTLVVHKRSSRFLS